MQRMLRMGVLCASLAFTGCCVTDCVRGTLHRVKAKVCCPDAVQLEMHPVTPPVVTPPVVEMPPR